MYNLVNKLCRGIPLVNSIKINRNLDVITSIKGIERKRYPIFEGENLMIYSPAIQSNVSDANEGVDISKENMVKIISSNKPTLVIIRYYNDFLIIEGQKLNKEIEKIQREGSKWSFKVKKLSDSQVELYLSRSNFTIFLEIHNTVSFKRTMENFYNVQFTELIGEKDVTTLIPHIHQYIKSKGFNYSLNNINNLYLSLRSKPFVIISGISGTGKTKIVQLFAESIGATDNNGQFTLIPVRPDWSDGSELLGYTDIKGDFIEGPLTKVVREASNNQDRPYFVLLDEMNLARVEYYFSDVLSIMESRSKDGDTYTSSTLITIDEEKLTLPNNLYIIGTVNMDETTHPFSKKVLDRANTIEFNEIDLNSFAFLENMAEVAPIQLANTSLEASFVQLKDCYKDNELIIKRVSNELTMINRIIEPLNAHVGYRVRDEICFYMIHNSEGPLFAKDDEAIDYCIMQKILPRLAGSGSKIRNVLENLFAHFTGDIYDASNEFDASMAKYPMSTKKVHDMLRRLGDEDFTSFWIS